MNDYLRTSLSGWIAFVLFVTGVVLPYLFRRKRTVGLFWIHYWIGYVLPLVAFLHAWLPMRTGNMKGINLTGIWLATFALGLLAWQVALGFLLRSSTESTRRRLRTTHFWTMVLLAGLIIAHIGLNRP